MSKKQIEPQSAQRVQRKNKKDIYFFETHPRQNREEQRITLITQIKNILIV